MKTVKVGDFLTDAELKKAMRLYDELDHTDRRHLFAQRAAEEIIGPVMDRINETLGQENDAKYLAYALEYAITQGIEH